MNLLDKRLARPHPGQGVVSVGTINSIGLTGGIGSGKSTVASLLVGLGATLVDTDAIARELTGPAGAAMPALVARFGHGICGADDALDRNAMRQLAFNDAAAKAALEAVLHPLIGELARARAAQAQAASPAAVVVYDVPLLAESASRHGVGSGAGSWRQRVQRVLVVDCAEATQIERVALRPGWDTEAAARVVAQQASRRQRRAVADAVIHNDGITLQALACEVQAVWRAWTPVEQSCELL